MNAEGAPRLKLLGRASSINVRKVLWTLAELALPFEHEPWGEGERSLKSAEFLALNPNALVPVLMFDGQAILESNTICRFLCAQFERWDLLPRNALERARVEQWMDWQATELNNAWRYAFMGLVRRSPAHQDALAIEQSVAGWNRHMHLLDAHLARSGGFAAGPAFSLADIPLGLSVVRWLATPMQRPALPAVERYVERLRQRPGFLQYGQNGMP